jgi:hypothetical protein
MLGGNCRAMLEGAGAARGAADRVAGRCWRRVGSAWGLLLLLEELSDARGGLLDDAGERLELLNGLPHMLEGLLAKVRVLLLEGELLAIAGGCWG